jgi:hypothetical protein
VNEETKEHPLAKVARYKLEQAEANGGHKLARWDSKEHAWHVTSATDKSKTYTLRLKQQDRKEAERRAALTHQQRTGYGWLFTLTCTCPAYSAGMFCWHMGAVRLWWSYHQALTGDQIAERNLRNQKQKALETTPNPLYGEEYDDDDSPFAHVPPMDEWDGTDPHVFNRSMVPMDRGQWNDEPDNLDVWNYPPEDRKRIGFMIDNTNILLNGGGKS